MSEDFFSPLVEQAIRLAAIAHVNQKRKHTEIPYLSHLMHVAMILIKAGFQDETVLAAAILHDVVEDTSFSQEDIVREFPGKVADLVEILTEIKEDENGEKKTWQERKDHHIEEIQAAPLEARAILLADKLHNLNTILLDQEGNENFWDRFNASGEKLLWYYRTIVELAAKDQPESLQNLARDCFHVLDQLESN